MPIGHAAYACRAHRTVPHLGTCTCTCTCTYMHMLMYMPCISRANSFKIPKCTFAEVFRKSATRTATAANRPRLSTCIEDFELDPFCYVGLSFSTHGTFALWGQLPPPSLVPRVLCGIDCQSGMRVHRTVPTRMWELRSTACDGDCHVHAYAYARACTCSCLVAA